MKGRKEENFTGNIEKIHSKTYKTEKVYHENK
jgi:hypothetical protein